MSKKKLITEGIVNELQGASLFFTRPATPPSPTPTPPVPPLTPKPSEPPPRLSENQPSPTKPVTPTSETQPRKERTDEQTNVTTPERKNERSRSRRKIRHTFDIFADQLLALREIALDFERGTGERVLLGDLAQQALDLFISKHRKNERSGVRSNSQQL